MDGDTPPGGTLPTGSDGGTAPDGVRPRSRQARFLPLARRAGWNVVDQMLVAVTSAVLFFVLAQAVTTRELDAFANAFYVFTMVIGVERALVGQVLGIRFSDSHGAPWRQALGQAFGFILCLTAAISVLIAGIGLALDGVHGRALLATALVLPGLILQDACRMAFFAQSRARDAAINDLLWATLQFSGVAWLLGVGRDQVPALILAWGGSAAICCVVALVRLGVTPDPRGAAAWARRSWDVSRYLLGENLLTVGAFNGGFLLVGALAGEGATSAIRGAQVLLGPLQTLASAMFTFTLPELSRRAWLSAATRWKVAATSSLLMLGAALGYTTVLLIVVERAPSLFDANWAGARSVLLPVGIGAAGAAACLGPAVMIYAMGLARKTFRLMTIEAPMVLTLMIGGALAFGVRGAAWGLMANQVLMVPLWFAQLRAVLRNPPSGSPVPAQVDLTAAEPDEITRAAGSPPATAGR